MSRCPKRVACERSPRIWEEGCALPGVAARKHKLAWGFRQPGFVIVRSPRCAAPSSIASSSRGSVYWRLGLCGQPVTRRFKTCRSTWPPIRALADYGDGSLRFAEFFEIELGRTQYLAFYLAAWVLAQFMSVLAAAKVLTTAAIVATPYCLRSLLRATDRDDRLAFFVLPLTWNAHLILGFINFIAAIPLALLGLSLAVQLRRRFTVGKAVGLAVVGLVTFYMHVVPFGFLGLGAALIAVGKPRETFRRWLPLGPSAVAMVVWSQMSPAGQATLTASRLADGVGPQPQFQPVSRALQEVPMWLTDILHTELDEQLLVAFLVLIVSAIVLGTKTPGDESSRSSRTRLALLAPLAAIAYFITPVSYDWIWPINARFALLTLVFLIPLMPMPKAWLGHLVTVGVMAVCVASFDEVTSAFEQFSEEVGELDEAIETIEPGAKVAGLIFDRGSTAVKFSPFIHSVAWYQAARGGAVMFTFADFPQSPIRFRSDNRPPAVPPRWEWMPERVDPQRDLAWYDWVLVRGGPGRIAQSGWTQVMRGPRWSVWRR